MTLDRLGVRIVAASTRLGCVGAPDGLRVGELVVRRAAVGDAWVREPAAGGAAGEVAPRDDIFAVDCDVLFACADARCIDASAAEGLAARSVVPAANDVCSLEVEADLVVLDPETVADRATFQDPHQYPVGIHYVFVNGKPVIRDGAHTQARPGSVLGR